MKVFSKIILDLLIDKISKDTNFDKKSITKLITSIFLILSFRINIETITTIKKNRKITKFSNKQRFSYQFTYRPTNHNIILYKKKNTTTLTEPITHCKPSKTKSKPNATQTTIWIEQKKVCRTLRLRNVNTITAVPSKHTETIKTLPGRPSPTTPHSF